MELLGLAIVIIHDYIQKNEMSKFFLIVFAIVENECENELDFIQQDLIGLLNLRFYYEQISLIKIKHLKIENEKHYLKIMWLQNGYKAQNEHYAIF